MMPTFRRLALAALRAIDLSDVVIVIGLATTAAGIAQLSVPWACITIGAVLFALGVTGLLRRRTR